ncbi:ferredoxin--NADP reductase [Streptomyces olivochromogenes]|uniref:Ferredoxin--NADP reductase n=2 Tax=Streptomyces olivochromogenes TaxID=1963 RepID=A0A250VU62_STROL|nr:ferredoxin--NADP reductase [Streptomyces olivochromogenes]
MATGMFLKSTPDATDLSAPESGGLSDFRRLHGESELTELTPIPCDVFVRYGQRFQKRYVGDVEPARVASVDRGPSAPGFVVGLDDGRQLTAAAVVVATGLNGLAYIPKELLRLAPEGAGAGALVSHTSHHSDLSRYAGQRIAVIGGGQSALESAALLHEAEAHVQVLVRERSVRWGSVPQPNRPWPQRLAQPASPWGRAGHSPRSAGHQAGCGGSRLLLFHRALGPSGGWWLRDRVEGVVPVRTSCRVTRAEASGSTARLELTGPGGSERLAVDHMLAATGYRLDIDALAFLAPALRRGVVRVPGSKAPRLTSTFETSVPGLYVTGSLAAPMFGPMMRFVAGTEYAAACVARDAARWVVAP